MGPENIAQHFPNIYKKLYNNVDNGTEISSLSQYLNANINSDSLNLVEKVDINVIRSSVSSMKDNKRDSVFDVTSDMYKHSPDKFYQHLAIIVRQSLIHGVLPDIVLLCTLLPLVKDNLGDITRSDNYRAIAGGCLILKVLDLVILNLEGSKPSTDALQFAYKPKKGTTSCTWLVSTVVDYFTRKGNPVFSASMDMSKAFDMVKWNELFNTLLDRKISPIVVRLLLHIYSSQMCTVKWGTRKQESSV